MIYNKNNELLQKDTSEFTYDENGNMISKTVAGSTTNYQYDIDNRLLSVEEDGSAVASYYYDPFGRRLWKDVDGTKTYFHYADEGLVAEADGTGAVVKSYGYVPNSTWTTDPLFMTVGGEYYFYQNDHLGTPQKMTSVTGAVVWSANYDAFGTAIVDPASSVVNNLRFAGQYFDAETELHYNWHRYYDPSTGRYLTVDPIGLEGGINLFSYANGNPVNVIDPIGFMGRKPDPADLNNAKKIVEFIEAIEKNPKVNPKSLIPKDSTLPMVLLLDAMSKSSICKQMLTVSNCSQFEGKMESCRLELYGKYNVITSHFYDASGAVAEEIFDIIVEKKRKKVCCKKK